LKEAGLPYFKTVIRRYKVFQKAALDGVLVSNVADPHAADAWKDYVAIVKEVLK
jgi:chromosome partitioning protein